MRRSLLLTFVGFLCISTGCNVVQWKQEDIESELGGAGMGPRQVTLGEATVHVWEGGQGQPVLLLHGFGPAGIWQWHDLASELALDHRVIVPDLLWFGASHSERRDFSVDHQAQTMNALLDALQVQRVDVVGISYGGIVAFELASAFPDRVRKLVLVDSPARAYQVQDHEAMCERFGRTDVENVFVPTDAEGVNTLLQLGYIDPPWMPDFALTQAVESLYADHQAEKRELLGSLLSTIGALPPRPDYFRAETMVVWGKEDPVFPLVIGERLAAALDAPLEVIEDAAHAPNLEHPERLNDIIRNFLDAPAPGDGMESAPAGRPLNSP